MKALATSWPARRPELPDVRTVAEVGYPGMGANGMKEANEEIE
jgi:hypothetical protein